MRPEDWPLNDNGEYYTVGELLYEYEVPDPTFLADFNHQMKSVIKVVCNLVGKPKRDSSGQ